MKAKDNKEKDHTSITFRIDAELKKQLEELAEKDQRTLSNFIVLTLAKAVKESKGKK